MYKKQKVMTSLPNQIYFYISRLKFLIICEHVQMEWRDNTRWIRTKFIFNFD